MLSFWFFNLKRSSVLLKQPLISPSLSKFVDLYSDFADGTALRGGGGAAPHALSSRDTADCQINTIACR